MPTAIYIASNMVSCLYLLVVTAAAGELITMEMLAHGFCNKKEWANCMPLAYSIIQRQYSILIMTGYQQGACSWSIVGKMSSLKSVGSSTCDS